MNATQRQPDKRGWESLKGMITHRSRHQSHCCCVFFYLVVLGRRRLWCVLIYFDQTKKGKTLQTHISHIYSNDSAYLTTVVVGWRTMWCTRVKIKLRWNGWVRQNCRTVYKRYNTTFLHFFVIFPIKTAQKKLLHIEIKYTGNFHSSYQKCCVQFQLERDVQQLWDPLSSRFLGL